MTETPPRRPAKPAWYTPPKNALWLLAPFAVLALLAGLYTLYWNQTAAQSKAGIETWFEEQRAAGLAAQYDSLKIQGFPFRLEAELTGLAFGNPDTAADWHWETPKALVNALPYNLNHLILRLPEPVTYRFSPARVSGLGGGEERVYVFTSDTLHASAKLRAGRLSRFAAEAKTVSVVGERHFSDGDRAALATFRLDDGQFHLQQMPATDTDAPSLYFALSALGFDWPDSNLGEGPLPTRIDRLAVMGRLKDAPLTDAYWQTGQDILALLTQWAQDGGELELAKLELAWGSLDIDSAGDVHVAAAGTPEGEIKAKVAGIGELITAMEAAGRLKPEQATAYQGIVALLVQSQGGPSKTGQVDVPIALRNGALFLGPAQIADLPVLLPPR